MSLETPIRIALGLAIATAAFLFTPPKPAVTETQAQTATIDTARADIARQTGRLAAPAFPKE